MTGQAAAGQPGGSKIALALAGGGPEGSIWEIGAIRALDEALEGLDFNHIPLYLGISAGAFIASCLANNLSTAQMCRAIIKHEPGEHPFVPKNFLTPAMGQLVSCGMKVPGLLMDSLWEFVRNREERQVFDLVSRLSHALPVGLFENEPIRAYLEEVFSRPGRSDDFRDLGVDLELVATDLDSGVAVRFGSPGFDHVPISRAVQASTALPGLYPPVLIDGRYYVDGVLQKTVHASVALEKGADLVLCVNPIVPVDTIRSVEQGVMRRGNLVDRGLPTVLSQSLRTIIYSRMGVGLETYKSRFAGSDVLVFEPRRDDYEVFFSNVFSFANRKAVCEHAYRSTRRKLWRRRRRLQPILARHGIRLRTEILSEERDLWQSVGLGEKSNQAPVIRRLDRALGRLQSYVENRDFVGSFVAESGQLQ